MQAEFGDDRLHKRRHVGIAGSVLVKAAIRADSMAKRNVNVEMGDQIKI